ncbi:hypothetical protein ACJX0J_029336, partial [Zea mays]
QITFGRYGQWDLCISFSSAIFVDWSSHNLSVTAEVRTNTDDNKKLDSSPLRCFIPHVR